MTLSDSHTTSEHVCVVNECIEVVCVLLCVGGKMSPSQLVEAKYQGGVDWVGQVAVWEVFLEMGFGFGSYCQSLH